MQPKKELFIPVASTVEPKGILAKVMIFLVVAWLVSLIIYKNEGMSQEWDLFYYGAGEAWTLLVKLGGLMGIFLIFMTVWQVWLAWRYKPLAPCSDSQLPSVTVVVPAYNEGRQVLPTLRSILASDYPADKLQVIAVDDGSQDDTWSWICQAVDEAGGRIESLRLAANAGKRHALFAGFGRAWGEVLVTIDSDSEVDTDTLRHLVTPLAVNPQVGAVAGNVRVLNRSAGVIARMLEVSFTYSFDFVRAGQSVVNTVICTPGALSAYRSSVVAPHLEGWLNQRFMGRPATIGEDRALTNLVLRQGYFVHFAREAVVRTQVPLKYKPLCKMLLRWARSNVRETLVMTGFAFKRFRTAPASGARLLLISQWGTMTLGQILKVGGLALLAASPAPVLFHLMLGALMSALIPALVYLLRRRNSDFLWAFPYAIFWMAGLSWIAIYALVTPHRSRWMTRDLSPGRVASGARPGMALAKVGQPAVR